MEAGITESARGAMVRAAVAKVDSDGLKSALSLAVDPRHLAPKAVTNALNALRKHRDPASVVLKPQYRAALPYLAAAIADSCLARTIEVLGDHSDEPTKEQLLEALEEIRGEFTDVTIGVMLATVAEDDMPASDLCFEIAASDPRFGLSDLPDLSEGEGEAGTSGSGEEKRSGPTPEQREARRERKRREAQERRKKLEAARKASDQARRDRKKERASPTPSEGPREKASTAGVAPQLLRRATLTPVQQEEFDVLDPLVGSVVFAWVPFDPTVPDSTGLEGKSRRCVVVAASPTHLLVRPGYSDGGSKSRDWRSVPLRHWKQSGFERPTWVDGELLRVERTDEQSPVGKLAPDDWNALW
jgi:hypothetical protein